MEIKVSMFSKIPLESHMRINVTHDFFKSGV